MIPVRRSTRTASRRPVQAQADTPASSGRAAIVIRPERIVLAPPDTQPATGENCLDGVVTGVVYLGASTPVRVWLSDDALLTVTVPNLDGPVTVRHAPGAQVRCRAGRSARLLRDLDFGAVSVNTHAPMSAALPHCGFGASGYGKDLSSYGFEDYTRIKHVAQSLD